MILVKFVKSYPASYMANMDMARSVMRTFRRAGIPVNMSNGFNKHMNVNFTPPLPISVESEAEYMSIDTPMSAVEFLDRYNASCHPSLRAIAGLDCETNPNPAAKVYSSLYRVRGLGDYNALFVKTIEDSHEFYVKASKGDTLKEVRSLILDAYVEGDDLMLLLRSGNTTLRVDKVLEALTSDIENVPDYTIIRLEQFTENNLPLLEIARV